MLFQMSCRGTNASVEAASSETAALLRCVNSLRRLKSSLTINLKKENIYSKIIKNIHETKYLKPRHFQLV